MTLVGHPLSSDGVIPTLKANHFGQAKYALSKAMLTVSDQLLVLLVP